MALVEYRALVRALVRAQVRAQAQVQVRVQVRALVLVLARVQAQAPQLDQWGTSAEMSFLSHRRKKPDRTSSYK